MLNNVFNLKIHNIYAHSEMRHVGKVNRKEANQSVI